MRLRTALAAIALCGLALALFVCVRDPAFWPPTVMIALIAAALVVQRQRYGARQAPPAGAVSTDERFVDPESGRMMQVWYDPTSGERSYVEEQA